jgi:four helix bundle protein
MKKSIVADKSLKFAIRLIKLYKYLSETKREFIISKQLLRSGTAIGALICEAEHAESKADFLHKINISLKEANETNYWLLLLKEGGFLNEIEYENIWKECIELISILASIVKTTKVSSGKIK